MKYNDADANVDVDVAAVMLKDVIKWTTPRYVCVLVMYTCTYTYIYMCRIF